MATQREAESWLGIDERHIREIEHQVPGMRAARKVNDWQTYCRLACGYYREVKAGRLDPSGAGPLNLTEERARLAKEQADEKALSNAKRRGELLEAKDVEATWSGIVLTVKERLRSLPARAVQGVPGFRKSMAKKLAALVDEVLTELAHDGKPGAPAEQPDSGGDPIERPPEV